MSTPEPEDRVAIVNRVLELMKCQFRVEHKPDKRIKHWIVPLPGKLPWAKERPIVLNSNRNMFTHYSGYGMGGTMATALAMLTHWLRDEPHVSIRTWRYWCSDTVKIGPTEIVSVLEKSSYDEMTKCVLCGKETQNTDWWSDEKRRLIGPACWGGRCRNKTA